MTALALASTLIISGPDFTTRWEGVPHELCAFTALKFHLAGLSARCIDGVEA